MANLPPVLGCGVNRTGGDRTPKYCGGAIAIAMPAIVNARGAIAIAAQ
ncbi:hypothetical protein VB780_30090 [Leptolyngbya sp. CCNP1308]|nr:hypothetical protein [Leptolyngbya sp. CCNP1308]MEA5452860.1 hypothetical protein [Leptolyngbya sp. CCNP1308]